MRQSSRLDRRLPRWLAFLIATVFLAVGAVTTVASPASATQGDNYPEPWRSAPINSYVDSWGYYSRNCTSWAAWALHDRNGFEMPRAIGHAKQWGYWASSNGYQVNSTPAVGSIAWWNGGDYGHVAWVESVDGNQVTIQEYNYGIPPTGNYNRRIINKADPTGYIHFKDLSVSGSGTAKTTTSSSDVDKNGAADLVLTTNQPAGGSATSVLRSTWEGFIAPQQRWSDPTVGWAGIKPLVGDVNGDKKADYIFVANSGAGVRAYVALSTGTGFSVPQLWWSGDSYGYQGAKALMGDVDGNGAADLIFVYPGNAGGTVVTVALSTWQGFLTPQVWWSNSNYTFSELTPLVGDVKVTTDPVTGKPDGAADLVLMTDQGSGGTRAMVLVSSRSSFISPALWWSASYAYADVKPVLGDVDGNGAADLVLVHKLASGGTEVKVALSTWHGFIAMTTWWTATDYGWSGLTPLVGDVKITVDPVTGQPDGATDLVLLTNEGSNGTKAWVAASSRSSFVGSQLWWHGADWGYGGIKPSLG